MKRTDPLLEALQAGQSYTWTVPDGGDLASMRKAIKHGQTLTMSPVTDAGEIQVGDLVLVKWGQGDIFHIVGEIKDGRYLIVNSLGKVNGWVSSQEILGRITEVVEPEARPDVPHILDQLERTYHSFILLRQPNQDDSRRLLAVVDDLRWYATRIDPEDWDRMPRSNIWSFQQELWRLAKQARSSADESPDIRALIDSGKACVGSASEILRLFASNDL